MEELLQFLKLITGTCKNIAIFENNPEFTYIHMKVVREVDADSEVA